MLAKYFSGETAPDEEDVIDEWLREDPLNKDQYEELKSLWSGTTSNNSNWDVNTAWKSLLTKTNIEQGRVYTNSIITKMAYNKYRYASIAAVFLVIICGYFLISQSGFLNRNKSKTIEWIEKVTAPGEKAEIVLGDNSRIILNGSSRLKYLKRFNGIKREVELEGEAYFEITHKPDSPFLVHSRNIITTVLGTKFNVSAFRNEKNIAVSLVEGKVKISKSEINEEQPIIVLQPNQQFVYSREAKVSTIEQFDADKTIGWKDNILKFENETLEQVLIRLERAYGTKFELTSNSFKNFKVTANFRKESCTTITEVLKELTGLVVNTIKENNEIKKIVFEEK